MCHPSVHEYVQKMITADMVEGKCVLECGSFDVNGSVRPHCEAMNPKSYLGIDLRPGPRVDWVMTADEIPDHEDMTEMLEHVEDWKTAIYGMLVALKPGGHLVLTTRSPGFPLHDYPGDHWRYPKDDMHKILYLASLGILSLEDDPLPGHPGVFAHAIKAKNARPTTTEVIRLWEEEGIELPKPH
jgi:hypothetical protein